MRPFNLLKADMRRVARDMPLKVIAILTVVVNVFMLGSYKLLLVMAEHFPAEGMDEALGMLGMSSIASSAFFSCLSISNVGVLVCVAASMFIGKDFAYNTMRNKISCGNSRVKVYLSSLLSALIVGLGVLALSILESAALSAILFGSATPALQAVQASLISLPLYIGFIAVMTMVSMTLKSQVLGLVINIVIVAFIPGILQIIGMTGVETLKNVVGVIPYSVINELSVGTVSAGLAVKGTVGGLLLGAAATAVGCLLFGRADLK